MRCVHEASLHSRNSFITLTYADDPYSLCVRDWQLFAKRLRKKCGSFRFVMCGEYGERLGRPHYHALLFGLSFDDGVSVGKDIYRSAVLESVWPHGFSSFGSLTFESAAYVARYTVKKINGPSAPEHYDGRMPEFLLCSRRPGVGAGWIQQFGSDVFPRDEVISRGHPCRPPKYYDNFIPAEHAAVVKAEREKLAQRYLRTAEATAERRAVRERVAIARSEFHQSRVLK